jgi:hypothetical protein
MIEEAIQSAAPNALPAARAYDPIVEFYRKEVDYETLRQNLKLTE